MTTNIPHSRRARRQAQFESQKTSSPASSAASSALDTGTGTTTPPKTLVQLVEERQALLAQGTPFPTATTPTITPKITRTKISPNGLLTHEEEETEDTSSPEPSTTPLLDALFLTLSLSALHFTLDVLVHHQYLQDLAWASIVRRTFTTAPVLLCLIYQLHRPERANLLIGQIFFFGLAAGAGCSLIYAANVAEYFAVMKRAPPLGTLWVWSVIELRLPWAVASLAVTGGFLWWGGYSIT
ncbi:MAG: hypothetical protein M1817_005716 [Caeruleum heppii]|nr:MAG: hypothetical protein M1817_005716 [Caeruleum heppii]